MSIFIMILLIGLLILVHEAGHFFAARAFGIKVERFGFGLPFGPTLLTKQCGDVEVVVHAFLLGGYVSFPDDDEKSELPKDSPERFANKPIWQRAIVVSAGVIANAVCALVLVFAVAVFSKQLPSGNYEVFASSINAPEGASIYSSGMQSGDRILNVNGCDINNVYTFVTLVKSSAKDNGLISQKSIDENYSLLKALNPGLEKDELIPNELSVRLPQTPYEEELTMDKYAAKGAKYFKRDAFPLDKNLAPLKSDVEGKRVYISNGKYSLYDIAQVLSDGNHPVNITVLRDGQEVKLNPIYPDEKGVIGVGLSYKQIMDKTNTPALMVKGSVKYLYDNTYLMLYSLGQLFTGNIPFKDMHGVVAITKIGGDMIQKAGASSGVLLAALISMNLAILNILPIPVLDGGHLLFLLVEKITGKQPDEKVMSVITTIFFSLLIILMVLVLFNDITLLMKK